MERLVLRRKVEAMQIRGWKIASYQSSGVNVEDGYSEDLILMEKVDLTGMLKKLSETKHDNTD